VAQAVQSGWQAVGLAEGLAVQAGMPGQAGRHDGDSASLQAFASSAVDKAGQALTATVQWWQAAAARLAVGPLAMRVWIG
jgi:hypothetical protein